MCQHWPKVQISVGKLIIIIKSQDTSNPLIMYFNPLDLQVWKEVKAKSLADSKTFKEYRKIQLPC